ncbi:MAG: enoyl-CoA hydratase/isomerase family protein [Hyphomonadaceae bacterium]|nr:enoyl-CoA hydratase/isomerase family protein [Hyphomonadaceae bacterium]
MTLAPEPVSLEISPEGIAVVTLNRAAKRNAIDEIMIAGLAETFETLRGADHVRVVFLTGAGPHFCAGADIDWMRRQGEHLQADNETDALTFARMLKALHDLPVLTVALVHGAAMGGGAGLVAACDWAIATKDAHFRFSEVRLGITAATISPYVVEAIGARNARALFASAFPFGAEEALRMGLIHAVAEDQNELHIHLKRIAGLAMENAPGAVAESKALVRAVAGHPIDDRISKETAKRIAARRASPEGKEGLAAFLEKRRPNWDMP